MSINKIVQKPNEMTSDQEQAEREGEVTNQVVHGNSNEANYTTHNCNIIKETIVINIKS